MKPKKMVYKNEHIKEILYRGVKDGYPIVVMSYGFHPCGYVGIPKNHPFFGVHYDNYEPMHIDCHGGLTFSEMGCNNMPWYESEKDNEFWWIGWDYGHCDDYAPYYESFPWALNGLKKWTTEEVLDECYNVVEQLKNAII